jgi:ABC-2 type transport system ATP-binding protein
MQRVPEYNTKVAKKTSTLDMIEKPLLEIRELTKLYEAKKAVDAVSFSLKKGEVLGLLGPNGAGKTTTINMILGVLLPTSGTIEIFGKDLATHRTEVGPEVNFAAVYAHMLPNLTARQNLTVFGHLYGVKDLKNRINELLSDYELEEFADERAGLLSSGELSRLNLAKALINKPKLLLLDEPTASLDPSIAADIREKIQKFVKETQSAVLWTSHNMQEIETVCNEVLFLSHGKILLRGNPKTLPAKHGAQSLEELFIRVAREPLTFDED